MSRREIYREAKRQGLEIVEYECSHSGPALLFDTSGYWYEVTTRDPDGFEEIHTDSKQFVLEGIRKHGEAYRAALGSQS